MHRLIYFLITVIIGALNNNFAQLYAQNQEPPTYDDPFYKQKGLQESIIYRQKVPFQQVVENVDPFTGNLNLFHADIVLSGNGGLDLKIQRSYNSRIWGRTDVTSPGLVAQNEKSVMGIGWSFHFGRMLNPRGTGSSNRFVPDNPIFEMPDGSQHSLYRDKNNTNQMISREFWLYKRSSSSPLKYELLQSDGTIYTFAQKYSYNTIDKVEIYQVESIKTPNGNTIQFNYDETDARLIKSITETTGRLITFGYTIFGGNSCPQYALTSITANGKLYRYLYELKNCMLFLVEAQPPVGPSWKYIYHTSSPGLHELKTITYPNGAVQNYTYANVWFDVGPVDIPFTVVASRSLSGRNISTTTLTYKYSATGNQDQVTTIEQSGCKTERYTYSSFASLPNQGTSNKLWKIGTLSKKEIIWNGRTIQQETYDWTPSTSISLDDISNGAWNGTIGFLHDTEIFIPILSSRSIKRDDQTYKTTYGNHDDYGNPRTITETGDATRVTTLTYYYDSAKNIVKAHPTQQETAVGGERFTNRFSYDAYGNMLTQERYGVLTRFGYTDGNKSSRTDARGNKTSFQYRYGMVSQITNPIYSFNRTINWEGTVASETDGRGNTTRYLYDDLNRVTKITPPLESATIIAYDDINGTFWKVSKGSSFSRFEVDGLGRVVDTEASENMKTSSTYDACGQVTYRSYTYTNVNMGDKFAYDALGRITRVEHPDGKTQTFSYSGSEIAITNEKSITTTYRYTAFGDPDQKRLSSVQDATGTTTYSYNTVDGLTKITHPNGTVRNYTRNSNNFLVSETHPEVGTITYGRDPVGNMISRTDANGVRTFTYDVINRLTKISFPGASNKQTSFEYDNADNRTVVGSSDVKVVYNYNAENRLIKQVLNVDGQVFFTTYGYDAVGNLRNLTYPTGRVLTYNYDTANRVKSLDGFVNDMTYHPSGNMASIIFKNGKTTNFTHDNRYRVSSIRTAGILDMTYNYDGVGNVTSIVDALDKDRNRTLSYDNMDRLISANGSWGTMAFSYDVQGNRTSKAVNGVVTTYLYSNSRLTSATGGEPDTYTYDMIGNITGIRGHSLTYDVEGRLTNVDGGKASYGYDGDGKRIQKINQLTEETILYHYDQKGNLLAETELNGAPIAEYVYINDQHIAKILQTTISRPVSVNITTPSNGSTVSGTAVVVSAAASASAGIAGVEFWKDDQMLGSEDKDAPYSTFWNTKTVSDGPHKLFAIARTLTGILAVSSEVSVQVLNTTSPDLIVENLTHSPQNPRTKEKITFTAVVKNIGNGLSSPSILNLKVGGETNGKNYTIQSLDPGQSFTVQREEVLNVAQNYRNTATADIDNQVVESKEDNNQKTDDYTVRVPVPSLSYVGVLILLVLIILVDLFRKRVSSTYKRVG